MPTLSVAMIVKDEEQDLAQCLATVKDWVDEIVILDSGSTDNTEQIALEYGAKFYTHTNWQGFGKQRQIAQRYVTSDYILWLDADERITPLLKETILNAIKNDKENVVYAIGRLSKVFGKEIHHCGWYPDYVVRLYKTATTHYNDNLVHEKVIIRNNTLIEKLDGDLLHYPYKSINHYLVKSAKYAKEWAEQKNRENKKSSLSKAIAHSLGSFVKMYFLKKGFLDGKQGFLLAVLSAQSVFVKYADLWVRNIK